MKNETQLKCQVLIRTWRILKSYFEYELNANVFGKFKVTKTANSETYHCGDSYITRTAKQITISGFNVKELSTLIMAIQNILGEENLLSYDVYRNGTHISINHGIVKDLFEKDIFHHSFLAIEDEMV